MRTIYFNDQTKAFIEKDFDIVFLGNLYLKGKPYTNPKEAVDKEYVDNQWDNITEAQLTKTRFNPKNFPGFNADLINKEGTNNFTLKKVIRAGKYHKVSIDNRGRVVGGRTGKITFDSSDFGGISFNKLTYDKYKNTNGVYGKPNKIADFTNKLNTNDYLFKSRDVHINRPLRIDSGPKTEFNIINEDDVVKVSNEYFKGEVIGVRERTFSGYGDWGGAVSDNYDINLKPWRFQRSFNPNRGNLISGKYRVLQDRTMTLFPERIPLTRIIVYENRIYNITGNDDNMWSCALLSNGEINRESFERVKFSSKEMPPKYPLYLRERECCIWNNKIFMSTRYTTSENVYSPHYYFSEYVINGLDIKLIANNHRGTADGGPFYPNMRGFIRFPHWDSPSGLHFIYEKGQLRTQRFGGETNAVFFTESDYGNVVHLGGYYYSFPRDTSHNYVNRIRSVNDLPTGLWERFYLDKPIPAFTSKVFFTSMDKLYVAGRSGRRMVIYSYDFDRVTGDIYGQSEVFNEDVNLNSGLRNVFITKNHLFIYTNNTLVELEYKGGLNNYAAQSMTDYIPPHP